MRNNIFNLSLVLLIVLAGCTKGVSDISSSSSSSSSGSPSPGGQGGGGNPNQPGVITAGEWNDLENWTFWGTIIKDQFRPLQEYWSFFNNNRISVNVAGVDSKPVVDASVKLKRDGTVIFSAKTDNKGNAELWPDLFENNPNIDYSKLSIDINNGSGTISQVKPYKDGVNNIVVSPTTIINNIEVAFVVDATGSMGDELEYLKTELLDVIKRVKNENLTSTISTSAVFYRDKGDDYVTRVSNFTTDNSVTINFIKGQFAGGGGDMPEAVHSALDKAVTELQWSSNAKTRLLFLVLDAPPHYESAVVKSIQTSIGMAAEKGIKVIPVTASGIDKKTEFLMRFLSISTNGTYVFITNHSGIGNSHLEASVGPYQVEFLNNLMVRLINKYAK